MSPFEFIKLTFGVWYIAHAVTATHGPLGIFEWMREKLPHGRQGYLVLTAGETGIEITPPVPRHNGLLDCIICFAPWAALGLLLIPFKKVRDVLALAGGALLLHSFTGWRFSE